MDFFDIVAKRHSIRKYTSLDVDSVAIDRILNAVNLAPSAGDLQAYEVVVVRSEETRQALANAAYGQEYVVEAPVVMVFCADHLTSGSKYGERGTSLYAIQDATIAASYAQLAATALGLATCWIGAFDTEAVAEIIDLPTQISPVAMVTIGYSAEVPNPTPRRHLNDIVRLEKF